MISKFEIRMPKSETNPNERMGQRFLHRLAMIGALALLPCGMAADRPAWDDLPPVQPSANDWPWWCGPNRDSIAPAQQSPPVRWSATENVIWKTAVPGQGHGSPCVWGDQIFLPTSDNDAQTQSLLCYDRKTGRKLWQTELHRGGFVKSHKKNSHASATPACDGRLVFMTFVIQNAI